MPLVSRNPIFDEHFYVHEAQKYCRSLPLEHFMESTPSATQRKITVASFELVHAARPEVVCFNELLVQYPVADIRDIGRVVPDNMVVVHDGEVRAKTSFNTPFEEAKPFLVLEYVSQDSVRKDYPDNMRRYERDLQVPYYLLFDPEKKQLLVFKLSAGKRKYVSVKPNKDDRLAIPELDLEAGLVDDWTRYWFRGKLLPLPAELAAELDETKRQLRDARSEIARLQAELRRLRGE